MKIKIRGLVFVGFAAAVFAQSALAEITADDKTVTSKTYVDSKVEATVNNATTITAGSPDDKAPSSLNVYKFVENRIISSGGGVDGNVDYHTDKIGYLDSTWAQANNTGLTSPYMVTKADLAAHPTWAEHVVKWEIIVPDARVAESASDITSAGASGASTTVQTNLTTAKAVYDFVTGEGDPDGGFHPKLTSTQASALAGWGNGGQSDQGTAIAVGYRVYDSSDPNAEQASEWKIFGARGNGSGTDDDYHLSYLTVQPGTNQERDKYFIDIKASALAKNATAISDGGTATGAAASQTADKLATAKAVYDYAVKKQWDASDEGKHLVIDSTGAVVLSENANPDIPGADDMPEACSTANGNHVCALVAYYDANAGGTGVGGVAYEWTVMAPTGSGTGGGSGSGTGGGTGA